jgi:hypothetical protein
MGTLQSGGSGNLAGQIKQVYVLRDKLTVVLKA